MKTLFEEKLDTIKKDAVKFTIERQMENKIPFLNTMVEIISDTLTMDLYRKPTSIMRLMTSILTMTLSIK